MLQEGLRSADINTSHAQYCFFTQHKAKFLQVEQDYLFDQSSPRHARLVYEDEVVFDTRNQTATELVAGMQLPIKRRHLYVWGESNTGKTTFVQRLKSLNWVVETMDTRGTLYNAHPQMMVFDDPAELLFNTLSKISQGGAQFEEHAYRSRVDLSPHCQIIVLSNKRYRDLITFSNDIEVDAFLNRFHTMEIRSGSYMCDMLEIDS